VEAGQIDQASHTAPANISKGYPQFVATLNEAWRQTLVRVELTVHADNARAIALYEKVGFETEGTLKDAVRIDGRYKDLILMAIVNHSPAAPNVLSGLMPQ
jgi:RimJ/RimL family protein N-acetyltransferase